MEILVAIENVREAERKFQKEISEVEEALNCKMVGFFESSEPIIEKFLKIKTPTFDDELNFLADLIEKEHKLVRSFIKLESTFLNLDPNWSGNDFIFWAIVHAFVPEEYLEDEILIDQLLNLDLSREEIIQKFRHLIESYRFKKKKKKELQEYLKGKPDILEILDQYVEADNAIEEMIARGHEGRNDETQSR